MSCNDDAAVTQNDIRKLQRKRIECPPFAKSMAASTKQFSKDSQNPLQFLYELIQNIDGSAHRSLALSLTRALCCYDPRDPKHLKCSYRLLLSC